MSDSIITTYDKIAQDFARTRFPDFYDEEFAKFSKLVPSGKILDVACGTGRDARYFIDRYQYLGVDGSERMLEIAKKNNPNSDFEQMDFHQLNFENNHFDGFWAAAAYLHEPKSEIIQSLKELGRVIKPGGIGLFGMKEMHKSWEGTLTEQRFEGREPISRYFAYYEVAEFQKILETCGFEVLDSYVKHADSKDWQIFFVRRG